MMQTSESSPSDDIDFSEEESSSSASSSTSESSSSSSSASASSASSGGAPSSSAASQTPAGGSQGSYQQEGSQHAGGSRQQGSPADSGPMTSAERVAALEGQLEASMASYDGMILREREYALSRSNQKGSEDELEAADAAGGGGLPYDEAGEEGEGGNDGYGQAPQPPGPEGEGLPGDGNDSSSSGSGTRPAGNQSREGDYQSAGAYSPPADIPDGSDDDVVARQIREAAMNEPDPELREKLWEEYRKYKNQ